MIGENLKLIQNNQKQIDLLEEKAKLIYNKVSSGKLNNYIIDDVIDIINGPSIGRKQHRQTGSIRLSNIRLFTNDEFNFKTAKFIDTLEAEKKYKKYLLKENDLLVVSATTSFGKHITIRHIHLPLLLNNNIYNFVPKEPLNAAYLKAYITHGDFKKKMSSVTTGTIIIHTNKTHLKSLDIKLPNIGIVNELNDQFSEIYNKKKALLDENYCLRSLV